MILGYYMYKDLRFKVAIFLWLLLLFGTGAFFGPQAGAQPIGNEWIRSGNVYYKFKIKKQGLYRISQSRLSQLGMANVPGSQFAIFREGREVPIFTTTSGVFGTGDYIEFYGDQADGKIDAELYTQPAYQPNPDVNLIDDTAYYFLTYDNTVHARLSQVANTLPSPLPAPASYCWARSKPTINIRDAWCPGVSYSTTEFYYSGEFDLGEGYAYNGLASNVSLDIPVPKVFTGGPSAEFAFALSGHSNPTVFPYLPVQHWARVRINSNDVFDTAFTGYNMVKKKMAIPASSLSSGCNLNVLDVANFFLLDASVRYPRTFDFSGTWSQRAFFQLEAGFRYLDISGFANGPQAARLYDFSQSKVYTAVPNSGRLQYYLDPSASTRDLFLCGGDQVDAVEDFSEVRFRDYSQAANQGDYIILTHREYIEASPSYVNDYRDYRAGMAGGSHKPLVVDVDELYDQFGYGFVFHPLAIRRFVKYALDQWATPPEYLFVIGKGVKYTEYRRYASDRASFPFVAVPTWGEPGSDNLYSRFNNSNRQLLATGRLSVYNNQQIGNYLEKVKAYEEALKPAPIPTLQTDGWKKVGLHIAGANSIDLQDLVLVPTLAQCRQVFEDSLIGGKVTTIRKNSSSSVEEINDMTIDSIMGKGLRQITFYGHASSNGFDYNLNAPDNYNSKPRFPVFDAYGCSVAYIYTLTNSLTIGEKYLHSEKGGCIAMIAGDNTGWTSFLTPYAINLYKSLGYRNYGRTLGIQYRNNINDLLANNPSDKSWYIHAESILLLGDPGLNQYNPSLPDFVVETDGLTTDPPIITTSIDSFDLKARIYNLGKATHDSLWVRVQHWRPNAGAPAFVDSVRLPYLMFSDSLSFKMPINPNLDIGLNRYIVKVDAGDEHEEISEANNEASLQVFIYSENLVPVYPKEFAIVYDKDLTLKASTLNAFAPSRNYKLEMDTTEQFNSPLKVSNEVISSGGVIKWKPGVLLMDSTVYYWRTAPDTLVDGKYSWTNSSFVFLEKGSEGWNQSHYYQYAKDKPFTNMQNNDNTGRKFAFATYNNKLRAENAVVFPALGNYDQVRESLNDIPLLKFACQHDGSLTIVVIDPKSGKPWMDTPSGTAGSVPACDPRNRQVFEFSVENTSARNVLKAFLENIPDGHYVLVRNYIHSGPPGVLWNRQASAEWKADENVNGTGISLYHTLKGMGFSIIDQYDTKKPFLFFARKGTPTYPVHQLVGQDSTSFITFTAEFPSYPDSGQVASTLIGPAKEWKSMLWKVSGNDPQQDDVAVEVYAVDAQQRESYFTTVRGSDTSLAFISAQTYPYIRLRWLSADTVDRTSPHLDYWRVLYSPVPEAALNAAALFSFKDSLSEGQKGKLKVAIENLSPWPMSEMLVRYKVIDENNVSHPYSEVRYRALPGNDTLVAEVDIDLDKYPGTNYFMIEANPDNDQPEQYHPNNIGYLKVHMEADKKNPLLDVTFDGIHILDKDIVSSKPFIKILLNDENKFLPLNDTALLKLQLRAPNSQELKDIPFDGTVCKFIPADLDKGKNEAWIEFRPYLEEDGVYRLIVGGKDKSGNIAGKSLKYEVDFTVENKPSITHVLNYPNPFSTSTQFVFTLTGSEVPSQFKIQILTVTGKVVREIKKTELGNLHIGRNLTEYKWDGKDEYGQLLGNGVYLYRVVTSIDGQSVEHRSNSKIDKFFKNGYGKLYIMR